MRLTIFAVIVLPIFCIISEHSVYAQGSIDYFPMTREEVIEKTMKPIDYSFKYITTPRVDKMTLDNKVMCGYQGWFTSPGDGSYMDWFHWGWYEGFRPGSASIDFWPDMSDLQPDEHYQTSFTHADGSIATVYSSMNEKTVHRHFKWMRDYGIDGVFIQRFVIQTIAPAHLNHTNTVLRNCIGGAIRYGRSFAIMYDLSMMEEGMIDFIIEDWKLLVDKMKILDDPNYQHHLARPVVGIWGIGFNDNREYTLKECDRLLTFLKIDPNYGGCTIMVGIPTYWRTLDRDSVTDTYLHDIVKKADILSPWNVGRIQTIDEIESFAKEQWVKDLEWCSTNRKDYMPVLYPGFSCNNMFPETPLDMIPRLGGKFLWKQYVEAKKAGVEMIYQAMFDEVDEGTAIFKCTNDPPVGESNFLTYEGLPSDHYLWLTGEGQRLLRDEIMPVEPLPVRE